jgi:hypothetical protein
MDDSRLRNVIRNSVLCGMCVVVLCITTLLFVPTQTDFATVTTTMQSTTTSASSSNTLITPSPAPSFTPLPRDHAADDESRRLFGNETFVLISIDGLAADYWSLYRHENLDALASAGIRARSMRPVFPSKSKLE